jgi:hypothetical protein
MSADQSHRPEPSQSHKKVTKNVGGHEFTAGFYPGFARSVVVNGESVYDQATDGPNPFVLPNGSERPWSSSAVELSSGKGYSVLLYIDDPRHVVERIEVTLRTPGGVGAFEGGGAASGEPDVVVIENTPVICPPFC